MKGPIEFIQSILQETKEFLKKKKKKQNKTKEERKLGLKLECDNLSVTTKMSFNSLKLFSISNKKKKKNSCNYSHECDGLHPPKQHLIWLLRG